MATPSSNAVAQLLARGRSFLGYRETPARSNRTRFGKQYGWDAVAWCVIYVWCILQDVGSSAAILKTASTGALEAWGKSVGRFSRTPHVGDVIILRNSKGATAHTELVYAWNGRRLLGIGGNTSGGAGSVADGGTVAINDRTDLYRRGRITFVRPFHGVTTEDVLLVQATAGLPRTGVINAATVTAVKRLQGQHNLTRDGFPGPATIAALGGTQQATRVAEEDDMYNDQDRARDARIAQIAELTDERINGKVAAQVSRILQIGELSDINLNGAGRIAALTGQVAGLGEAVKQLGAGQGIDLTAITAAAEKGAREGAATVSAEDVAAKLTVQTKP